MTGRHARIVYDLDAPVYDPADETPSADVCPIHGAECEAWK